MIVNKKQLAEIHGVSERALTEWQAQGLPMVLKGERGLENQYDVAATIEWRIQRALAGEKTETQRERRERLEGDMLELKLAREAQLLLARDDIVPMWEGAILAARANLLGWADHVKGELDARYGIDVDVHLLRDAVDQALAKLAEGPPIKADDDTEAFAEEEGEED